ncbi:MAG TPA: MFS transporter, partial [Micromonosporaceae bacterium]
LLIAADLGRAALLGSIPIAALIGSVTLIHLYLVVFGTGVLTIIFGVASRSYLPFLVGREHLIEGNAALQNNYSVSAAAGTALSGYFVQWFTAPFVLIADAVSYLWSAAWLTSISAENVRPATVRRVSLRREIADGLSFVARQPVLRAIAVSTAAAFFFSAVGNAIRIFFLVQSIGLFAGTIGVVGMASLVGAIPAALVSRRLTDAVGRARLCIVASIVLGAAMLLVPLTAPGWRLSLFVVSGFITSFAIIVLRVVQSSIQQALCPDRMLGRMNATMQFLSTAMSPVGSVAGGVLATIAGLRATFWVAGIGTLLSALPLLLSPLRSLGDDFSDHLADTEYGDATDDLNASHPHGRRAAPLPRDPGQDREGAV